MICVLRNTCPTISFENNDGQSAVINNGLPIVVSINETYNTPDYNVIVFASIAFIRLSFYRYLIVPNILGNFDFQVRVVSNDGTFGCTSNVLNVQVNSLSLVTTDSGSVTTDADNVTTDASIN